MNKLERHFDFKGLVYKIKQSIGLNIEVIAQEIIVEFVKSSTGRYVIAQQSDGSVVWKTEIINGRLEVTQHLINLPPDDLVISFMEPNGTVYRSDSGYARFT